MAVRGVARARRGPLAGTWIFELDSEWRLRMSCHAVRLAIRTSRPYLSATSVRLEHIRTLDHACEQHQRTVAQLRVMRQGRLFARRTATRYVNGRRATWPMG
jgi:hypothetical protein